MPKMRTIPVALSSSYFTFEPREISTTELTWKRSSRSLRQQISSSESDFVPANLTSWHAVLRYSGNLGPVQIPCLELLGLCPGHAKDETRAICWEASAQVLLSKPGSALPASS